MNYIYREMEKLMIFLLSRYEKHPFHIPSDEKHPIWNLATGARPVWGLAGVEGLIGAAVEPMATAGVTAVFCLGKDGNLKI